MIDWTKVQKKYHGVWFRPYFYELANEDNFKPYMWYSMIDCAPTCVWNKKTILDINKIY